MSEHPASEQISSVAQRIYQDLPSAKILEGDLNARSAFVSSTERGATVLTNIAKIGALASLPVGIVLLISYLHDEGAPLPATDNSIGALLSLVCVTFLFFSLVLTSIFLLPTFAKIAGTLRSEPAADSFHRTKKQLTVWQKLTQSGKEYYLRFGPFFR